jgi:hypothetical protein
MLGNHKKLKKYQYLYLQEKLCAWDWYNEVLQDESYNKRITFYCNWLKKINERYNYA